MTYSKDYQILLDLMIRLVGSPAGQKICNEDAWLNDAQTLSIKLLRHLISMQTCSGGATVEHDGKPVIWFIDHASIKVIARAALETYLVFFYIYGQSDKELSKFRHKTWVLGGLKDRQKMHTTIEEHKEKLSQEKQQIYKLQSEIEASPYIKYFTNKQRKQLLDGNWKIGNGWSSLGVDAGFHETYFNNIYSYLCGYSHSSYISALQVGQAQDIKEQQELSQFALGVGVVIMAHFSFTYSALFEPASKVFNADVVGKEIADKWHFGPSDLAHIYNR
ncbi:MAG TPA: hypothetical protein ENJ37_04905 [Deltaproteobacteria bacterium]|nr:hypothetical protein [Deltaproteobacteria bacterium]